MRLCPLGCAFLLVVSVSGCNSATALPESGPDARSGVVITEGEIEALVPNDGQEYLGRTIVVTDPQGTPSEHCFESYTDYTSVVRSAQGGATRITVNFQAGVPITPGNRYVVVGQTTCNGSFRLTLSPL
jgi:hypothetical protein